MKGHPPTFSDHHFRRPPANIRGDNCAINVAGEFGIHGCCGKHKSSLFIPADDTGSTTECSAEADNCAFGIGCIAKGTRGNGNSLGCAVVCGENGKGCECGFRVADRLRTQLCSTIHANTEPGLNDLFTEDAISVTDNHLDRVGPDINRADRWSIRMALHASTLP